MMRLDKRYASKKLQRKVKHVIGSNFVAPKPSAKAVARKLKKEAL